MSVVEFLTHPIFLVIVGPLIGNVTALYVPRSWPLLSRARRILEQGLQLIDVLEEPNEEVRQKAIERGLSAFAKRIREGA